MIQETRAAASESGQSSADPRGLCVIPGLGRLQNKVTKCAETGRKYMQRTVRTGKLLSDWYSKGTLSRVKSQLQAVGMPENLQHLMIPLCLISALGKPC